MKIQVIKNRYIYFGIALVLILIGIGCMIFNTAKGNGPFNFDVQFTGGTAVDVNIGTEFSNDDIAAIITDVTNNKSPQIQKVGADGTQVTIKIKSIDPDTRTALKEAILEKYPGATDFSVSDVSGTVSKEMQRAAILAIIVACIAMLIYVTVRFHDVKTGSSAVMALIHDALMVICCYAVFRIPLSTTFIAVILTILGYSINASIVIFDRVRENRRRIRDDAELIDVSINQTLTRSLFTSFTTFLTVLSLYIFGVKDIKDFALPIMVGVICGTYSSVLLSGNFWYMLSNAGKKENK
jgi:protein-export membrane protein, SecD/SecF family/protein-export membrane protein SecF